MSTRRLHFLTLTLGAAAFLSYLIAVFSTTANMDMALHFDFARRMVEGAVPYVDFIDMNFPLIWLLYAPGAWLSLQGLLQPDVALALSHFVLSCLFFCAYYLLARSFLRDKTLESPWLWLLIVFALFFPLYQMHQRDHLGLIFILPYALLRANQGPMSKPAVGSWSFAFIAAVAALGFNIKPHFLALWLTLELAVWIRQRRVTIDAGHLLIGGFSAAYLLLVLLVWPHITDAVRLAASCYSRNIPLLKFVTGPAALLVYGLSALTALLSRRSTLHTMIVPLIALAWVALGIAWIQRVGTSYHYICALGFAAAACLVQFGNVAAEAGESRGRLLTAVALGVCLFGISALGMINAFDLFSWKFNPRPAITLFRAISSRLNKPELTIDNLSASVFPQSPAFLSVGGRPQSPFSCLWFLGNMYPEVPADADPFPYHSPQNMDRQEREMFDLVVKNAVAHPPDIFLVSVSTFKEYMRNGRFDFLQYYGQDPSFSRLLSNYRLQDGLRGVQVLTRRDAMQE